MTPGRAARDHTLLPVPEVHGGPLPEGVHEAFPALQVEPPVVVPPPLPAESSASASATPSAPPAALALPGDLPALPGDAALAPVPVIPLLPGRLDGEALVAWERLARVRGPGERRAALLALVLTPGSSRERQAWGEETTGVDNAATVLAQVGLLPPAARLPVYERLLALTVETPLDERRDLLAATRRVMSADGRIGVLDRLRWLLMRHRLAARPEIHHAGVRESNELSGLPLAMRLALARWSAYLARVVPQADPAAVVGSAGAQWYGQVVRTLWGAAPDLPACQPPDADALGRALQTIEGLPWMRRPLVARTWVEAAWPAGVAWPPPAERLPGAEALRMACQMLDTPLPPALARQFTEPPLRPLVRTAAGF